MFSRVLVPIRRIQPPDSATGFLGDGRRDGRKPHPGCVHSGRG